MHHFSNCYHRYTINLIITQSDRSRKHFSDDKNAQRSLSQLMMKTGAILAPKPSQNIYK